MKRGLRLLPGAAVLLVAASLSTGCAGGTVRGVRALRFSPVDFSPPAPAVHRLDNGLMLLVLPDREVPLVRFTLLVRAGSVFEEEGKTGLAGLAGEVIGTGGAGDRTPEELTSRLEFMGAELSTSIGRESGSVGLSLLSADFREGFSILAEVLRAPRFDAREVERAARREIERIRRIEDDPDAVAFREFRAALYGDDPRGRRPDAASVAGLTRADLEGYYRKYFHPERIILGITGDVDGEEAVALARRLLGDWTPSGKTPPAFPLPRPDLPAAPVAVVVPKDLSQSTIVMGHSAPPIGSEDFFAFTLLEHIVGGSGFNSRLTREIRSNRGLAYSVGSFYSPARGYGVFGAYCKTGAASTVPAARLMREIIRRVRDEGVTAAEVQGAKDAIVNRLVFSVDSTAEVVSRRMNYRYLGLPPDFLEQYRDRIEAVTAGEVNEAARRLLRPDESVLVVVGDEGEFTGPLAGFGPLTRIIQQER